MCALGIERQEIDEHQAVGVCFAAIGSQTMMDEMTIRVAIRATARMSFILFLGAFLGNAFYSLVPAATTRWLKANKDRLTLGFAASHTVHLAFILTLMVAIGREHAFKGTMVVAFTTGFLFIYAVCWCSVFASPILVTMV
jgi:methionine sulfoxide reductase heme-binding subunit